MEELSSGNITLLDPVAGWNYFKEYGETQGHWYYFDEEKSEWVTGWVLVDGKWYYLKESGSMMTGWALVNGHWYYLNADGSMATSRAFVNGKWYGFKENGAMISDWKNVKTGWKIENYII